MISPFPYFVFIVFGGGKAIKIRHAKNSKETVCVKG